MNVSLKLNSKMNSSEHVVNEITGCNEQNVWFPWFILYDEVLCLHLSL